MRYTRHSRTKAGKMMKNATGFWEILGVTRHLIIVMVMQHGGYKLMGLQLDTEPTLWYWSVSKPPGSQWSNLNQNSISKYCISEGKKKLGETFDTPYICWGSLPIDGYLWLGIRTVSVCVQGRTSCPLQEFDGSDSGARPDEAATWRTNDDSVFVTRRYMCL